MLLTSCEQQSRVNGNIERGYQWDKKSLVIEQSETLKIKFTGFVNESIEVEYLKQGIKQLPSLAKKESIIPVKCVLEQDEENFYFTNGLLTAIINKSNFSISFQRKGQLLFKQAGVTLKKSKREFKFTLDKNEKIMGGGERILGMNRRGHRMPLYNKAHYGYTTESNQMYYGLPVIMSDKKYGIIFDNSASGFLDIGKSEKDILSFESIGGRSAYIVYSGESYPQLINHFVNVTGKQPLPPRWAFGNFSSRFGYRNQQQVLDTVARFDAADIPLDTVILDLYWFGPDIKGHLGNFAWDRENFPQPEKMIKQLKGQGINTIVITEPFVLSSSDNWKNAVDNKVMAKNINGEVARFDFYFGNTGLIDVFDDNAQSWFWQFYQQLFAQGVAGVWGDLGEPEVHPHDSIHYWSEINEFVRGDEIHNAYGHQWAKMVYQRQRELSPDSRPFIMMRSGFAGSQRFGMIPWTGDVSRSWDGLKPQVELSLQMGLFGLGYTHSDLGGFAGGEKFDQELYIRWLQYGVFQPVYRPHAQDNIAPEPVFHDLETQSIIRDYIKLRYRLFPYIYTTAYQNSTTGMPFMRPLFFEQEQNEHLFSIKDTYLWGDSFLVSPITSPGKTSHSVILPEGNWFNYWNDELYSGNSTVEIPVTLETIPVLVRAGAFIPTVEPVNSLENYSGEKIKLHYYADKSVSKSQGAMYEDDGHSPLSIEHKNYDLLEFYSTHQQNKLLINFVKKGLSYQGAPDKRQINLVVHNWQVQPEKVIVDQKLISRLNSKVSLNDSMSGFYYDQENSLLLLNFTWDNNDLDVVIE